MKLGALVLVLTLSSAAHAGPLADVLVESWPDYLSPERAAAHVFAARAASVETGIDPLLLLGMAYHESRFQPDAVSRRHCEGETCVRRASHWRSRTRGADFRGPYFCGVLQVEARSWRQCLAWRDDLVATYREAAHHLRWWLDEPHCRGDLRCALLGYGGGYRLIEVGSSYPRRCLHKAAQIRRRLDDKLAS